MQFTNVLEYKVGINIQHNTIKILMEFLSSTTSQQKNNLKHYHHYQLPCPQYFQVQHTT